DPIDEPVKNAVADVTVHNHLPLSGQIVVLITHDSTLFRTNPAATDTLITIEVPTPVYANGRVVEPVEATTFIGLLDWQIDLFREAPIYLQPVFLIAGTGEDTLAAYGTDYMGFSAIGRFIYNIETD
ncbi:hypothetical protein AMJ86_04010, partial [bacterium SM23_57]